MVQSRTVTQNNSRDTPEAPKKRARQVARMSEVTEIYDGKIRIHKTTHSGDVWQMRMYIAEERKYIRASLRTRDKQVAKTLAENEFIKYRAKLLNGEKIFSLSADELRKKYLIHVGELVESGQTSEGRARNIKTFIGHYVRFVGATMKIQSIDKKFFRGYRAFRQKNLPTITMTTVVNESSAIKQLYSYAVSEGLISENYSPDFGVIKVMKNEVKRDSFTVKEYKQLVKCASQWYTRVPQSSAKKEEESYYRKTIRDFILLMGNFGFRTGELVQLKYRNVITHPDGTATVVILPETSKVRETREVRGRRGDVFERRKLYSPFASPDDYVFSHFKHKKPITKELLYGYYEDLVGEVKAGNPDYDETKTLYSLRHLWITMHLIIGKVSVHKIARYAGTSLLQIQKHYDNVKDKHISDEILSYKLKFDANDGIMIDDEIEIS
jgi:integrase